MQLVGLLTVKQMEKMAGGAVVVGLRVDAPAVFVKLIPVEQDCAEAASESIGHRDLFMARTLGFQRAEHRAAGEPSSRCAKRPLDVFFAGFVRGPSSAGQASHAARAASICIRQAPP